MSDNVVTLAKTERGYIRSLIASHPVTSVLAAFGAGFGAFFILWGFVL